LTKVSGKRIVKISQEGYYTVVVTDENGCSGTHTFNVYDTNDKVEALFVVPSLVTNGDNVIFSFVSELIPDTYFWDFGDGSSSKKPNPIYRYLSTGEYEVMLQVANEFCADSNTKGIEVQNIDFFNSGEADLFSSILSLEFSPNPVHEFLNVDFELSEKSSVYVGIYDIKGFLKEQRIIEVLNEQIQFDLRDYTVGTYFLYVQSGQDYSVNRFIKN
jgi:PKD repeat protein